MKNLIPVVALALMPQSNLSFASDNLLRCWDETFAYNTIQLDEVEDAYEMVLTGSRLSGDDIRTVNDLIFSLSSDEFGWHPGFGVLVRFPKGDCQVDAVGLRAQCDWRLVGDHNFMSKVFVTYKSGDITAAWPFNSVIVPLSPGRSGGPVQRIWVDISATTGHIKIQTEDENGTPSVQTVAATDSQVGPSGRPLTCGFGPQAPTIDISFPERLRDYLRRSP